MVEKKMPPQRIIIRVVNTSTAPPPPLPAPQQVDVAVFQAAVTATMAVAMAQISMGGTNRMGNGTNNSDQGES